MQTFILGKKKRKPDPYDEISQIIDTIIVDRERLNDGKIYFTKEQWKNFVSNTWIK